MTDIELPRPTSRAAAPATNRTFIDVINDYVAIMKPGIIVLLLVTTLGAMLIAVRGVPPLSLVLWTMLGGLLSSGGAGALNCYIDRDIDQYMHRTRRRGTASGTISPRAALNFGILLSVAGTLVFLIFVNPLAALLSLIGNLYYVLVYSLWLKRRTPNNIVVGGAAGAMPPLVGWAAATGTLSPAAFVLFAIIYYWTPPHFWSLALLKQGEYGRVHVPMLPVVAGAAETQKQILLYTILLAAVGLLLVPLTMGWLYLIGALIINGIFVWLAVRLVREGTKKLARQTFFYSLWYLALIFAVMVADRMLLT
jgi:protoheme IX farnesyltransferase